MLREYRNGKDSAGLLLLSIDAQLANSTLRHLEQALSPAAKQRETTIERKASCSPDLKASSDLWRRAAERGELRNACDLA